MMNQLVMATLLTLELPAIVKHLSREFAVFHLSSTASGHIWRK
jgi:hypothetical protein